MARSPAAKAIYRPGHSFKKASVLLLELQPETITQGHLFLEVDHGRWSKTDRRSSQLLMTAVDSINQQFGAGTIQYAVAGLQKPWCMNCSKRSPRWTTVWKEIPRAIAQI